MSSDFTNESALFIKVHSLEIGFVGGEDLVCLWDDPDLKERIMVSERNVKYE
jgi:hypothetical protein